MKLWTLAVSNLDFLGARHGQAIKPVGNLRNRGSVRLCADGAGAGFFLLSVRRISAISASADDATALCTPRQRECRRRRIPGAPAALLFLFGRSAGLLCA